MRVRRFGSLSLLVAALLCTTAAVALVVVRLHPLPSSVLPASALAASALPPLGLTRRDEDFLPDREPTSEAGRLSRRDLQSAVDKMHAALQTCKPEAMQEPTLISAQLTIAPTGIVQSVNLLPPEVDSVAKKCIVAVLSATPFPSFREPTTPIEWTFPILLE